MSFGGGGGGNVKSCSFFPISSLPGAFFWSSAPFSHPRSSYGSADGSNPNNPSSPSVVAPTYSTWNGQYFHADDCDSVGLLCLHRALEGGESDIVSAHHLYNVYIRTWSRRSPSRYGVSTVKAKSARAKMNESGPPFSIEREGGGRVFLKYDIRFLPLFWSCSEFWARAKGNGKEGTFDFIPCDYILYLSETSID